MEPKELHEALENYLLKEKGLHPDDANDYFVNELFEMLEGDINETHK